MHILKIVDLRLCDALDKVKNDVLDLTRLVPVCGYAEKRNDVGRCPAVDAYVDLARQILQCSLSVLSGIV